MLGKVLVATDGSEPAKNALRYVLKYAPEGAEIIVLSVTPPVKDREDFGRLLNQGESYKLLFKRILAESEAISKEVRPDVMVRLLLREGKPKDVIVETAYEEGVDMIVMGSRGIGGVEGWLLGSTSRAVVNECRNPILIIK
jgi:nucleotide-binding universal stress UspA family protein